MSPSSRYLACISYLLSLPGALFVLLARRDDGFATFHAHQSLRLAIVGLIAPLIWALVAWGLAWLPLFGAMLSVISFALVLAVYTGILISWIMGMLYSLKGQLRPPPLFGTQSPRRQTEQFQEAPATTAELIERTTPVDA